MRNLQLTSSQLQRCFPQIWALRRNSGQLYGDGKRRGRHLPMLIFPSLSLAPEPARMGPVSFLGQGGGLVLRSGARWPDTW